MIRYTALCLSFILILFSCSGSSIGHTISFVYAESDIEEKKDVFPKNTPQPSTSTPIVSAPSIKNETPSLDTQASDLKESPTPSSTPNSYEKIASIPDWYKNEEAGIKVPILMYHNLLEGSSIGDGLNVSAKAFDAQMRQLKAYGYNTISFKELYNHYMNGASLPANPIIITFDDGYESNYSIGYPILKKYGLTACIFVITNAIGNKNYMNEAQLKEISSSAVIDIQSHSASHAYDLSSMNKNDMAAELHNSKEKLESITGVNVNIFCYPYGKYSQRLVNELIEQDYVFSVTTKYGVASKKAHPFLLSRLRVMGSDSGMDLKNNIERLTGRKTKFIGIDEEITSPEPAPLPEQEQEQTPEPPVEANPETPPDPSPEQDLESPSPPPNDTGTDLKTNDPEQQDGVEPSTDQEQEELPESSTEVVPD